MKKRYVILLSIPAILALVSQFVLRIPIWHIGAAADVSTGLGAKIACSGYFVSGFSKQQIIDDLATYSPANRMLEIHYDDATKSVTADLLGVSTASAKFREHLGCSLTYEEAPLADTQLTPVETVDTGWPAGARVEDIDLALQSKLDALVKADNLSGLDTRAFVVIHNGKLIAESYKPGISHDTPLLGWSMGKSVTAMMIGNLEMQQKLTVSDRGLFNEWQQDARKDISLESLLTMTSGLDFDETYAPGSDSTRMLFTEPSASGVALASDSELSPGQHFSYSSGTTNILARLVHETVGGSEQSSMDFLFDNVLRPLGMANTYFEPDASGVFVGSSYIYANGRDWARLGLLMLNGGELNGYRLLSEDFVRRASQPNSSENDPRYGYQFWLNGGGQSLRWPNLPEDAYAMTGNRSQLVMIIPSKKAVLVRLGWTKGRYPSDDKFSEVLSWLE